MLKKVKWMNILGHVTHIVYQVCSVQSLDNGNNRYSERTPINTVTTVVVVRIKIKILGVSVHPLPFTHAWEGVNLGSDRLSVLPWKKILGFANVLMCAFVFGICWFT
jgi:hypothetical protein